MVATETDSVSEPCQKTETILTSEPKWLIRNNRCERAETPDGNTCDERAKRRDRNIDLERASAVDGNNADERANLLD